MHERLISYVKKSHKGQVRKYTTEPYFTHLKAVADMAASTNASYGWEIGLCHDLFEDTDQKPHHLYQILLECGYGKVSIGHILACVNDLTDLYTSEKFPDMNRAERKNKECKRLWDAIGDAQTVKYCDLIHNTSSIVQFDPKFAKIYLPEKQRILLGMNRGDSAMYSKCWDSLHDAFKQLNL